jgi:DNA-binding CsgD family transcriptional regulator
MNEAPAMPSEAAVGAFLDELYSAAIFPQRWTDVVSGFRDLWKDDFGEILTHMTLIDLEAGRTDHSIICGADPELVRLGSEHYFSQDIYVQAGHSKFMEAVRGGKEQLVIVSDELIPRRDLESTEFYNDFLRPFRVTDMLGATSVVGPNKLINLVVNPIDSRPVSDADVDLVTRLLPHVDRACRMSIKLGYSQAGSAAAYMWESSPLPVMVVQQGRLTYANQAAERVLKASAIVTRSGAGLRFMDESANNAMKELARLRRPGEATAARQVAMEIHDDAGEAWMLQVVRLNPPAEDLVARLFGVSPGVFVMLSPLSSASALRAGAISSIASFTAVETEILHALVDGKTMRQIASESGRSEATIRWHVRNLLSKSGSKSTTDLIRFASLLVPL